ncbi:MAG: replicative DNA helicase [candidate division WS1 bacterium]|jgi:replicative DNA helicase|nr:replicative DNA helicase [candidate division WS1 bacterium]
MIEESRRQPRGSLADRLPPQDLEAEQATLGSMLIEPGAVSRAMAIVSEEDFYREAHRRIFSAIRAVDEAGDPVDVVTVGAELRRREQLAAVGGGEYLTRLIGEVPTTAHIIRYSTIVHEKAVLRRLITAGGEIQALGYDNPEDLQSALDSAEQRIFEIAQQRSSREYEDIGPLVHATMLHLEEASKRGETVTGIPTGLDDFDRLTAGLQNGDLVILAGRPSMGKTSLMVNNVALGAATNRKRPVPVGIFSLEMSASQLAEMLLCGRARVNGWSLRAGRTRQDDWGRIGAAAGALASARIFIDDTPGISIMELRSKARRMKSNEDIGLICVDYLQLVSTGAARSENRHQEIGEVARAMKAMARELNIPVVLGSQLSRNVERREEKRPILSDLAESGSIEAEADIVCMLFRPSYYEKKKNVEETEAEERARIEREKNQPKGPDKAELIVAKHRNGPVGTIELHFQQDYRIFDNFDRFREG